MKFKKTFVAIPLAIIILIIGYTQIFPIDTTSVEASSQWKVVTDINTDLSESILNRKNIEENSKKKLGYNIKDEKTVGKLIMNFNKREINKDNKYELFASGEGVVKINNHTFPINFENVIVEKLKINNEVIYSSNIVSKVKSKSSNYEDIALTMYWNPKVDRVQASITVGNMPNYGLALFGEQFIDYNSLTNVKKVPFK